MTLVMTSLTFARVFSMFVYIRAHFRSMLIGRDLTAQSTGSHKGIGGGIQILETSLQALPPSPQFFVVCLFAFLSAPLENILTFRVQIQCFVSIRWKTWKAIPAWKARKSWEQLCWIGTPGKGVLLLGHSSVSSNSSWKTNFEPDFPFCGEGSGVRCLLKMDGFLVYLTHGSALP